MTQSFFLQGVVTFALIYHQPLTYNGYVYPEWAEWLGWTLAFSSILMIPGMAILQMCRASGSFKKVIEMHKYTNVEL